MTHLPNDPYADAPYGADEYPAEPDRTSALAILSLVCGVLCCIPVLPTIGAALGLGALVGIKSSNGRVGGTGLAIAGLILGGVGTVAQVGLALGVRQGLSAFVNDVVPQVDALMIDIEAGDHAAAASRFDAPIEPGITPERLDAFRAAYTAELGAYQSVPADFGSMLSAYQALGPAFQAYNQAGGGGGQAEFPIPAEFANGPALLIVRMPQTPTGAPTAGSFPFANVVILTNDGSRFVLHDPLTSSAPTPGTPETPSGSVGDDQDTDGDDNGDGPSEDDGP